MVTITKKDVAKKTAKLVGERIYTTEKIVDGVFAALRQFMEEADPEIRIEIRDFGVFEVKKTRPKPKAEIPKPARSSMSRRVARPTSRLANCSKKCSKDPSVTIPWVASWGLITATVASAWRSAIRWR